MKIKNICKIFTPLSPYLAFDLLLNKYLFLLPHCQTESSSLNFSTKIPRNKLNVEENKFRTYTKITVYFIRHQILVENKKLSIFVCTYNSDNFRILFLPYFYYYCIMSKLEDSIEKSTECDTWSPDSFGKDKRSLKMKQARITMQGFYFLYIF